MARALPSAFCCSAKAGDCDRIRIARPRSPERLVAFLSPERSCSVCCAFDALVGAEDGAAIQRHRSLLRRVVQRIVGRPLELLLL